MNINRSIEETSGHRHPILPDAETYRVRKCRVDSDFAAGGKTTVWLTAIQKATGMKVHLKFTDVHFEEPIFMPLRDATGLYVMDTQHLGWAADQRIEVGDEDDGSPIFWAQGAERTTEDRGCQQPPA
jgi:hypothetical protein